MLSDWQCQSGFR